MSTSPTTLMIPNQAVFVWDDSFFPYGAYLSLSSAARRGGFETIYLLKTPALDGVELFERLRREVPHLRPVNIDLKGWLEEARIDCVDALLEADRFLKERKFHGSVSDMLRSLWLLLHGGVYLDTDTLCLKTFGALLDQQGFLAQEHILVSSKVYRTNSRWRYFKTAPLTLYRDICSKVSFGVTCFRWLESLYVKSIHNAVMGFSPGHPMMRDVLGQIAVRYPKRPERYPLLGPDTLQDLEEENSYDGVGIYPPAYFSPLGPIMTFQYFHLRRRKTIEALRQTAVCPETTALHWSGNGTIGRVTPKNDDDVRRLADQQLFSRLALEVALGERVSSS